MTLNFLLAAAAMVAATLLLLFRPWQRRRPSSTPTPDAVGLNTALYREAIADLDVEQAQGTLAPGDIGPARAELERRLLEDVSTGTVVPSPVASGLGRFTVWGLVLALPLAAAGLYAVLGTPAALLPGATTTAAPTFTPDQINNMVATLATRLQQHPDDPKGWSMLARSYHVMGRMDEAVKAFEHIGPSLNQDAVLLSEYADALATLAQGNMAGKPSQLIAQALQLDPDQPMAVELAATEAMQKHDTAAAVGYFEHALKLLPPDSEDARWVSQQLTTLRGGQAPAAMAAAGPQTGDAPAAPAVDPAAANASAITGHVSLAPELAAKLNPEDTLFLMARPSQGSRMPLAIQRLKAGQLPLDFRLDDSNAMSPQATLSGATAVVVEARISHSGTAMPAPGDLYVESAVIKPGTQGLSLVINRVR